MSGPGSQRRESQQATRVRAIVRAHRGQRGALLPILHGVQQELGWVPPDAVPVIAEELNLSRADVHGVLTFYRDFRSAPEQRRVLRVCRAEACQAVGGEEVAAAAARRAGDGLGVDDVYCLGNCALGPSVMLDGVVHGRLTPERLPDLLAAVPEPAPAEPAPAEPAPAEPTAPQPLPSGRGHIRTAQPELTVYVPRDTSARAVGADRVAARIEAAAAASGRAVRLVRNGSRGALWLEPLVEVATAEGRIGYGPVAPDDVADLVASGLLDPDGESDHPLRLGPVEAIPWLREQDRVTFARVGVIDPLSPGDYQQHGGIAGLRRALAMSPDEVVAEVTDSGLRGRGGAGFPAGVKWRTVLGAEGPEKFICCNADEGDSGTFADRMLIEGDPFTVIEGMLIAAHAVGAGSGYVYLRSEYPDAGAILRAAIDVAREQGWLGEQVLGSGLSFDITVRVGAGAYICGEETSMLESLEGRRGVVRAKPPLPALQGLFGRPTVVNNVITLATVPAVLADGAQAYAGLGVERSRGTSVFQLGGNVARGGIVETAFGLTLGDLVRRWGGGTRTGRPVRAVQVGGPLGAYLPASRFDLPMDYEAFAAAGAMVGHGGVVLFDDTVDMAAQAKFAFDFCAEESCGKCTPCRVGAVRGSETVARIAAGQDVGQNLLLLDELCELMADGSLCAMGGLTPMPVRSAIQHFPEDFDRPAGAAAPAATGGGPP